jgi:ABC-type antimicrobial peptide transport system permease subunit
VALPLAYNVRNVRVRWPVMLLAVLAIALVVAVFAVLLAMSQGFAAALRGTGREDNAIVTSRGSNSEVTSRVELEERNAILDHVSAVRGPDGQALESGEFVSVLALPRKSDGRRSNVILRRVTPRAFLVRGGIRVTEGRRFTPGLEEVIVGRRIRDRIRGLELGGTFRYRRRELRIVGVFDSPDAAFESEVWGDFDSLVGRRGPVLSSLVLRVRDAAEIAELDRWMRLQPNMRLRAVSERQYYEDQAGPVANTIRALSGLVAIVTGIGAVFAAMNTMYRVVASRTREIGTLRALGFSRRAVLLSFLVESTLVGLAGGVLGCLVASSLDGFSTSTANLQSFSEVAFAFRITPGIVASSMGFALAMGVLGGLLPAARAARLPIAGALRGD